jgi:uncharacterized iron-regulated membrane protein
MVKRTIAVKIRKAHRYLGLFLGLQFIMWTVSGLYFSWTDLDEIHGDHYKQLPLKRTAFTNLLGTAQLEGVKEIKSLQLLDIAGQPFYWINENVLFNAQTGEKKKSVSQKEALSVAAQHMRPDLKVTSVVQLDEVDAHHEYRGRPLPAYEISYDTVDDLKAYVALSNGAFQTVRHRNWRWFDFLWMTHTMDYQGRDDFNTSVLRAFSLLGLITVLSGFLLWATSSQTLRKLLGRNSISSS